MATKPKQLVQRHMEHYCGSCGRLTYTTMKKVELKLANGSVRVVPVICMHCLPSKMFK